MGYCHCTLSIRPQSYERPRLRSLLRIPFWRSRASRPEPYGSWLWVKNRRTPKWLALVNGHMDSNLRSPGGFSLTQTQLSKSGTSPSRLPVGTKRCEWNCLNRFVQCVVPDSLGSVLRFRRKMPKSMACQCFHNRSMAAWGARVHCGVRISFEVTLAWNGFLTFLSPILARATPKFGNIPQKTRGFPGTPNLPGLKKFGNIPTFSAFSFGQL